MNDWAKKKAIERRLIRDMNTAFGSSRARIAALYGNEKPASEEAGESTGALKHVTENGVTPPGEYASLPLRGQ